jgi:histidine ammonia-lyase
MNAAQAIEFRRPAKTSPYLEGLLADYREAVAFITVDKVMYPEIEKTVEFIRNGEFEAPQQ